jgi:hypothetical protein
LLSLHRVCNIPPEYGENFSPSKGVCRISRRNLKKEYHLVYVETVFASFSANVILCAVSDWV